MEEVVGEYLGEEDLHAALRQHLQVDAGLLQGGDIADRDAVDALLGADGVAAELDQLLEVRTAVDGDAALAPEFVGATMARIPTRSPADAVWADAMGRGLPWIAGGVSGVMATLATFFALLATGGRSLSGPLSILAIAVVVGVVVVGIGARSAPRPEPG